MQLPTKPTVLVANLPYNISVPVLLNLLERFPSINRGVVMVQSEVAYRSIILDKNQKQYLYTGSFCQLQARIIQPENMSPPLSPVPNPGIVEVLDLCE